MSGLIGQNLGRYQILELIGTGGMATVYKAHDTHLERDVVPGIFLAARAEVFALIRASNWTRSITAHTSAFDAR